MNLSSFINNNNNNNNDLNSNLIVALSKENTRRTKADVLIIFDVLQNNPLLSHFDREAKLGISKFCSVECYERGTMLLNLGTIVNKKHALITDDSDKNDKLFFIVSGGVDVVWDGSMIGTMGKGKGFSKNMLNLDEFDIGTLVCATDCVFAVVSKVDYEDVDRHFKLRALVEKIKIVCNQFTTLPRYSNTTVRGLAPIAKIFHLSKHSKGHSVLAQGEESRFLGFVVSGILSLCYTAKFQKKNGDVAYEHTLVLDRLKPGDVFGSLEVYAVTGRWKENFGSIEVESEDGAEVALCSVHQFMTKAPLAMRLESFGLSVGFSKRVEMNLSRLIRKKEREGWVPVDPCKVPIVVPKSNFDVDGSLLSSSAAPPSVPRMLSYASSFSLARSCCQCECHRKTAPTVSTASKTSHHHTIQPAKPAPTRRFQPPSPQPRVIGSPFIPKFRSSPRGVWIRSSPTTTTKAVSCSSSFAPPSHSYSSPSPHPPSSLRPTSAVVKNNVNNNFLKSSRPQSAPAKYRTGFTTTSNNNNINANANTVVTYCYKCSCKEDDESDLTVVLNETENDLEQQKENQNEDEHNQEQDDDEQDDEQDEDDGTHENEEDFFRYSDTSSIATNESFVDAETMEAMDAKMWCRLYPGCKCELCLTSNPKSKVFHQSMTDVAHSAVATGFSHNPKLQKYLARAKEYSDTGNGGKSGVSMPTIAATAAAGDAGNDKKKKKIAHTHSKKKGAPSSPTYRRLVEFDKDESLTSDVVRAQLGQPNTDLVGGEMVKTGHVRLSSVSTMGRRQDKRYGFKQALE